MFEFLNIPFIFISIIIFVVLVNEKPVIENIDTLFYPVVFVLGILVGMIKDYLLSLKNNPERKPAPPIFQSAAIKD